MFTVAQLKRTYGIKPALVTALVNAGVIAPSRGKGGAYQLDFQDVVLLRSAAALSATDIAPARLARFLRVLRGRLPPDAPLSSVRVQVLGRELVVKIGDAMENIAGQRVLDFAEPVAVSRQLGTRPMEIKTRVDAEVAGQFQRENVDERLSRVQALEASDRTAAVDQYRKLLKDEPDCIDAALNLCVLLIETGDVQGAYRVGRDALSRHPEHALLNYNFGVACEECERYGEALTAYTHALAIDATLADAHFNAAQLHDSLGNRRDALRHMSAYRRLQRT